MTRRDQQIAVIRQAAANERARIVNWLRRRRPANLPNLARMIENLEHLSDRDKQTLGIIDLAATARPPAKEQK